MTKKYILLHAYEQVKLMQDRPYWSESRDEEDDFYWLKQNVKNIGISKPNQIELNYMEIPHRFLFWQIIGLLENSSQKPARRKFYGRWQDTHIFLDGRGIDSYIWPPRSRRGQLPRLFFM